MKRIVLLRHGQAEAYREDDFSRRLTPQGRVQATRSARALGALELRQALICASPAARTRETAEILLQTLERPADDLLTDRKLYLAEAATLRAFLAAQRSHERDLILVGHNPGLSELAGYSLETAQFALLPDEPQAAPQSVD